MKKELLRKLPTPSYRNILKTYACLFVCFFFFLVFFFFLSLETNLLLTKKLKKATLSKGGELSIGSGIAAIRKIKIKTFLLQ
jgi:hypothetical protein